MTKLVRSDVLCGDRRAATFSAGGVLDDEPPDRAAGQVLSAAAGEQRFVFLATEFTRPAAHHPRRSIWSAACTSPCVTWTASSNASDPSDELRVRVTHPFRPLCGREFEFVRQLKDWGEDRVWLYDDQGWLRRADSSRSSQHQPGLEGAMRQRRRTPAGGVQAEKQQRYVRLIEQGVRNAEACRLVGINRKAGTRWRDGRSGPRFRRGGPALSGGEDHSREAAQPAVPQRAGADADRRSTRRGQHGPWDRRAG